MQGNLLFSYRRSPSEAGFRANRSHFSIRRGTTFVPEKPFGEFLRFANPVSCHGIFVS